MADNDILEDKEDNKEYMLSTLDNPYNPFTHFPEWYNFDISKGYNCCSFLAREFEEFSKPYLTWEQKAKLIQDAIKRIVFSDETGTFCRVSKDEVVKPIKID